MRFNIFDLETVKEQADERIKLVKDMLNKEGNNIYQDISGYEEEINYALYDVGEKATGLKRHIVSVTKIFPGEINGEYKMTTGHAHPQEEVYMFMKGEGKLILGDRDVKKEEHMFEGDSITIPSNVWHRVVNISKEVLEVLCFFESYKGRG